MAKVKWQRWDSNPRHRNDWYLKPAPYTTRPHYRNAFLQNIIFLRVSPEGVGKVTFSIVTIPVFQVKWLKSNGSGGIRTHAIEMTGALNQCLRPRGHATLSQKC